MTTKPSRDRRHSPSKRRFDGLLVQGHLAGRTDGSDQHIPGRRGHLRQHKRNFDPHRLHYRTIRHAGAIELVPSLVNNWHEAATDKEHTKA